MSTQAMIRLTPRQQAAAAFLKTLEDGEWHEEPRKQPLRRNSARNRAWRINCGRSALGDNVEARTQDGAILVRRRPDKDAEAA